jgi:hypothetical protein
MSMHQDRDMRVLLSHLSEAEYTLFEGYFQRQLAEALALADAAAQDSAAGAADPLAVEASLIEEIALVAEGQSPERQGIGFVPGPSGEYHLVPPRRNPFEDAPAVPGSAASPPQGMTQQRRFLLVGGILALAAVLLFLTMRDTTQPAARTQTSGPRASGGASPQASADPVEAGDPNAPAIEQIGAGASAAPIVDAEVRRAKASYPSSLEIVLPGSDTAPLTRSVPSALVYRVVPSTGQLGGQWTPTMAPGTAAWLSSSYVNSVFCLPPETAATLQELPIGTQVLMRPATGDVRAYEIVRVRQVGRQQTEVMSQRKAGMTLIACTTPGDERTVAEAVYLPPISREPAPVAAVGNELPGYLQVEVTDLEAHPINDEVVRLDVVVTLHNLGSDELRWTDLTDRLLIDGQAAQPATQPTWAPLAPDAERTEIYSYVVPRSTTGVLWQVLAPTGEGMDLQMAVPTVEQ